MICAVVVAGVALIGCSGNDTAASLPGLGASRTATRNATSGNGIVNEFPKSRVGAAAFARHYFDTYSAALASRDTTTMHRLASRSCRSCYNLVHYIDRARGYGYTIQGGQVTVVDSVAPPFTGRRVTVTTILNQAPGRVLSPAGDVRGHVFSASYDDNEVLLLWLDGRWQVAGITRYDPR